MKNNSYRELAEVIKKAGKIYLMPHIFMDGDTLGSCAALCRAIRLLGKECLIVTEDKIPDNLAFLDRGCCKREFENIGDADLSICVDCSDPDRFPKRKGLFDRSDRTMCIDHHKNTAYYCDYNYIDSRQAATGQIAYRLILALGVTVDKEMGEAIFAAITTDTGNFQYSNTTRESHEIAAALYDAGIDANGVSVELYENVRKERFLIKNKALGTLKTYCGGQLALAYVDRDMLKSAGARMEETEGVVEALRSISGVEVAVFLKKYDDSTVKVSLRSKKRVDVEEIAAEFGGGGHIRAAGCTFHCGLQEAAETLIKKISCILEKI